MPRRIVVFYLTFLAALPFLTTNLFAAEMDAKQVQIVAKVLSFLGKKPSANSIVVVEAGSANFDAVKAALATLKVVQGEVDNGSDVFAVFVASTAEARAITAAHQAIITVSSDVKCVEEAVCLIAVETQPKVSIYASRAAASRAGVNFDANFKMLITER